MNKKASTLAITLLIISMILVCIIAFYSEAKIGGWLVTLVFCAGIFIIIGIIVKKPINKSTYIVLTSLLTIAAISIIYNYFPRDEKFLGIITELGKVMVSTLDSGFKLAFGDNFTTALNKIAGVKSGMDFYKHFLYSLINGFIAFSLAYLGNYIILWVNYFLGKKTKGIIKRTVKPTWIRLMAGSMDKVIVFTLAYATLSQIGVVNRAIEIVTFYHLTNWFMYPIVLSVIFAYLPEILVQIGVYWYYLKEQRAIIRMKAGVKAIKTAGKVS
jgi:hypothetical protein